MDRRRARTRGLGLFILAVAAGSALAADAPAPPLRAMAWIPRDADAAEVFSRQPAECLRPPADPAAARSVAIGRAAFRTPLLLGGQAARAGLTCESCHRNGRGNPDFQFPGASGAPGTADVTLSLFSSRRGNGVHDPKPIPDLGGPRDRLKVAPDNLSAFIHGLVVEEFDGREPPAAVLQGLADYVRVLDPAACPAGLREPVTPGGLMDDSRRAIRAADAALAAGDRPTALLMLAAARARLGLIDERYAGQAEPVARLRAADTTLAALQARLRSADDLAGPRAALAGWLDQSRNLEAILAAHAKASLFNPQRLRDATNGRLPRNPS